MAAVGVLFAALFVVWAVSQWLQVADLRVHGVEATAKVEMVVREGKGHKALLEIPRPDGGTAEAWMDVPALSKMAEGNLIEVTYDPAHPDLVQHGWGIDYATPILVSVGAVAIAVAAVVGVRSAFTGRPLPSFRRPPRIAQQTARRRRKPVKRQRKQRRR